MASAPVILVSMSAIWRGRVKDFQISTSISGVFTTADVMVDTIDFFDVWVLSLVFHILCLQISL
jgi:hypothetical protein